MFSYFLLALVLRQTGLFPLHGEVSVWFSGVLFVAIGAVSEDVKGYLLMNPILHGISSCATPISPVTRRLELVAVLFLLGGVDADVVSSFERRSRRMIARAEEALRVPACPMGRHGAAGTDRPRGGRGEQETDQGPHARPVPGMRVRSIGFRLPGP